ncbi:hypothetical protein [Flavobacterium collinsii]|uniref:Muconolactone isomerase domain-containing protein n=1 Tax=Flavobacterium collinsii TaxID=1114861 RepID=A0ABM8KNM9_9FLAO|nr:hypothetical protein [Flavobacterium collinsii]CAA9202061.1 hypothetical protein FLACOL7796_04078 [Flavobacterium collinsii]
MRYLIITKGPSMLKNVELEKLLKIKEGLTQALKSGKIEACYGLVSGGTVWVLNSDSHAELARGLREYNLTDNHNIDILPIVDGMGVIDAYIKGLKEKQNEH